MQIREEYPYTLASRVNLLFFTKGTPTKDVWFYALPLPKSVGKNGFTKTMPLLDEHMDEVREWLGSPKPGGGGWNQKECPNAWKVGIGEIKARNWSLDFKNPNGSAAAEHKTPKELLGEIEDKESKIDRIIIELKKES